MKLNFFQRYALHFKLGAVYFITLPLVQFILFGTEISVKSACQNLISAFLFGLFFPMIVKYSEAKQQEK